MDLSDPKKAVAKAIREYMRQKSYDRDRFADKVHLSRSTIDKMLVGIYSDRALAQVEKNTGIKFGPQTEIVERASADLGSYARQEVEIYVGDYLFIRPSSSNPSRLQLYSFSIDWEAARPGLAMRQAKAEVGQVGYLSIPRSSMHVFVTSNDGGWIKLLAVSQLDAYRKMFGLLLTAGSVFGGVYIPVVIPVVMRKVSGSSGLLDAPRSVEPDDPAYEDLLADVKRVTTDGYARTIAIT